ncbi:MAG: methyltransferase domain-containing protein [Geodermatophilaceae bacterium]|nr:methyltransferase domain-containing protein [Geodermatophilaceae bacterium]
MDETRLMSFVGKAVTDLGTMVNGSLIVLGDKLGLYRAMAGQGAVTSSELARRTGCHERYLREWLSAQAATGYLVYEGGDRFSLPAEHAIPLTDEGSPACVIGGFQLALATMHSTERLTEAFRTGAGVGWSEHHHELFEGCERFFGPSYRSFLTQTWVPALDGVEAKLRHGARIADVGCGQGASTLLLAAAYPNSTVVGVDPHAGSLDAARKAAADQGLGDRVSFETGTAQDFGGRYDLVCFFDALHDMGDPAGACRHALAALQPGGTLMVVEPNAGDQVADNLNPVGAAYYSFSTMLCTPNSLSQDVGTALGAQAGEARLREVISGAGFSSVRRVSETPFNIVLEARG